MKGIFWKQRFDEVLKKFKRLKKFLKGTEFQRTTSKVDTALANSNSP